MSIRLGRSRTCFRREKLVRARGATIVLLKMRQPPLTAGRVGGARKLGAEPRRIADAHAPPQPPLWRRRGKRPLQRVAEESVSRVSPLAGETPHAVTYFSSTPAPAYSSSAFIFSASSFVT